MFKVNLGCGTKKIPGWINVDIRPETEPQLVWDTSKVLPWVGQVDVLYSCHNLEHYKRSEIPGILENWFRALKPGGELRISVPDFDAICRHYLYHKKLPKLYGLLHGGLKNDFDIHYISFDFDSLSEMLTSVGFENIERYDRWNTEHSYIDDYSAATLDPAFSRDGMLMSLNVRAFKK